MRFILIAVAFLVSESCFAQLGHDIHFQVTGLKDTTAYLAYYLGESTYIKDTARVNSKGEFAFTGKEPIQQGIYLLVVNKTRVMEFVVGKNQHFGLKTSTADYIKNMVVKNDVDNKLFFDNLMLRMERQKEAEPYIKVLQDSTLNEEQKKSARDSYSKITEKVIAYQEKLIAGNPETVTAIILKSSKPVKVPDAPRKSDGGIDSTFQLRWYRAHFFDNFDLANDMLTRLPQPEYSRKVNEYLDKLYAPQPDTVFQAIEKIVGTASKNSVTYQYIVRILIQKYWAPEIMGLDEVFVKIYDTYVASGQMDYWVNATFKKTLKEQADRLRKSLVGKKGDNLIMQDSNFKPRSMYDIKNKYTILYIFDPDCGHCKKETPKLVDFYNKLRSKFNVEVYAVNADTSMAKMRNYIKEMKMPWITVNGPRTYVGPYQDHYDANTTPSLYILDDKKKIIGKKIPAEKLEDFFTHYEKFQKAKATQKL
ncbi:Thioredoxin-like [Chryseolinea serpens]|uniref:Thioredoxin-like n=1 Tax=Chryseolinea serpens TaxID=947013 RepID=A0A1M5JVA8_9BACT|nr:thioredoxin-like domain-containing protein [Chryseolinea serpens]SHG44542.1 Thioredoxin-like [Chryseolinea serpens]